MENFKIKDEYIELIALLKAVGIAETGGHAKMMVDSGDVLRNGSPEIRKRANLIPGDVVEINGFKISVTK